MTLQAFLARLYVEAPFREKFFASPETFASSAGLSPAEARAVAAMDRDEIELAAASFEAKRSHKPN